MRKKGGRERKGERKKETIQTDLGESRRPLALTTEPSRESAGFGHGGIQGLSHGMQSLPPLRFCLPALLCGHKKAAAFPPASASLFSACSDSFCLGQHLL